MYSMFTWPLWISVGFKGKWQTPCPGPLHSRWRPANVCRWSCAMSLWKSLTQCARINMNIAWSSVVRRNGAFLQSKMRDGLQLFIFLDDIWQRMFHIRYAIHAGNVELSRNTDIAMFNPLMLRQIQETVYSNSYSSVNCFVCWINLV